MKVLLAHPGTQHSYRLAVELERRRALLDFYTGLAIPEGGFTDRVLRLMPTSWQRKLANRRIGGLPARRVRCRPIGELLALWQLRSARSDHDVLYRRSDRFQQSIPSSALAQASAVIAFDTSAWVLAERCAERSLPLVLDQTTPHPDAKLKIQREISKSFPEWGEVDALRPVALREAEEKEYCSAAKIVAASTFTRQTLTEHGVDASKVCVNPYGVDCERFSPNLSGKSGPLKFVFVGRLTAGKGIPLLLEAWRQLRTSGAELWFVGKCSPSVKKLLPDLPGLKYFGGVPREEVGWIMQQCDVFVFPSYFDGFGLVLLEAMACGLPVLTTTATGGPDIVAEGEDGWIIEPGNITQLEEQMTYAIDHADRVREMGAHARATAERFTWSAYGDRWMKILAEVCG